MFPKVNFMFHFGHLLVTSHSFVVETMTTGQPDVAYVIDGADPNHLWKTEEGPDMFYCLYQYIKSP